MQKQLIVDINQSTYPFGELQDSLSGTGKSLARKSLIFFDQEEHDIILNMVHFYKSIKHQSLINIIRVLQSENSFHLYYEYVPLRLERWVVDINETIGKELERQMMQLAVALAQANIRFQFNPSNIGLDKSMNLKYFLDEFSIDIEAQKENLEENQEKINFFFDMLNQEKEEPANKKYHKSVSTNPSFTHTDQIDIPQKSSEQTEKSTLTKKQLSEKLQNSIKKSMEVLNKFKKLGQNK